MLNGFAQHCNLPGMRFASTLPFDWDGATMKQSGLFSVRFLAGAAAMATFAFAGVARAEDRYAAIVIDARTNEVLLEDQANEARYPASLTKMMTLYMLFDAIERGELSPSTRLTVSRRASRMPASRLGLRRGSSISVDQAINAIVIKSANDVAVVVAERLAGSESRFAAQMTAKARDLGMTNTRFANASGLPDSRQRTTARDMAILGQALWRDFPQHYQRFSAEGWSYGRRYVRSHNRLVGAVEGVDGIKTGYTADSGYNLVSSAEREGRRVIVTVMGGESAQARDNQVAYLIEGAYEEYRRRALNAGPNAAAFASLPMQHLDVALTPSETGRGVDARVTRVFAPGPRGALADLPDSSGAVETLSSAREPDSSDALGQGDDADE